ncbi:LytR/AlgR family response regulator transcription factor [Novosphingopyxis sp.]|uniref:LytR/AlgR family response regulator transcription factor n=1 Tax=Novosphingopyxis sp. TaxID=2709690 RepID=UPI003B5CF8FC
MPSDRLAASPLLTLIVDDEPLAVERLERLVERIDALRLVGTAADGEAALERVRGGGISLLLLDIAMPGQDGMAVARALAAMADPPAIIFCTAFDGFAVEAFDLGVADYVLKPVAQERLEKAVARVTAARAEQADEPRGAQEFWVPHRSQLVRIAAADIDRIEAERDYMRLHLGERSYLLHETIGALEDRLDGEQFLRIHRSHIVRRDFIAGLRHEGGGVWHAQLADGESLRIGRKYLTATKEIAGR